MSTPAQAPGPLPGVAPMFPLKGIIHENLKELKSAWLCFVIFGVVLLLLGGAAMTYAVAASILTTLVFGYFLIAGGACYLIGSFFTRSWGGLFLSLLAGVLHLAAGFIIINHPGEAAILYTLLLAVFFFVEGLFRIVAAIAGGFQHRGFVLLNGIVTLALGVMIWRQWPLDGLWVVGFFVGINLIFSGVSYIMLGVGARKLPV